MVRAENPLYLAGTETQNGQYLSRLGPYLRDIGVVLSPKHFRAMQVAFPDLVHPFTNGFLVNGKAAGEHVDEIRQFAIELRRPTRSPEIQEYYRQRLLRVIDQYGVSHEITLEEALDHLTKAANKFYEFAGVELNRPEKVQQVIDESMPILTGKKGSFGDFKDFRTHFFTKRLLFSVISPDTDTLSNWLNRKVMERHVEGWEDRLIAESLEASHQSIRTRRSRQLDRQNPGRPKRPLTGRRPIYTEEQVINSYRIFRNATLDKYERLPTNADIEFAHQRGEFICTPHTVERLFGKGWQNAQQKLEEIIAKGDA